MKNPSYPTDYDIPKKNVLVLSCMDLRVTDDLLNFLHADNLQNRYDHFIFAGASLLCVAEVMCIKEEYKQYLIHAKGAFEHHVDLAIRLHYIEDIYIVEHRDCGAYGALEDNCIPATDTEFLLHRKYAVELADHIYKYTKDKKHPQKVTCFLIDLRGNVELLYKKYSYAPGIKFEEKKNPTTS